MKAVWFRGFVYQLVDAINKRIEASEKLLMHWEAKRAEEVAQYEAAPWYSRLLTSHPTARRYLEYSENDWAINDTKSRLLSLRNLRERALKAQADGAASIELDDDELLLLK